MSDDAFEVETKLQRGNGTNDRDTVKVSVSANDLDELDDKLESTRERVEEHVEKLRGIQPDDRTGRSISDDQAELDEVDE